MAIEILQEPLETVYTRNPVVVVARTDLPYDPRIQILCEIWFEQDFYGSNNFTHLVTVGGYPGALTNYDPDVLAVVFDISENLNKAMREYDLPGLNYNPNFITSCQHNIRRYLLKIYEWDGFAIITDGSNDKGPLEIGPKNCIRGGISYEDYPDANWFDQYQPVTKKFLTWMPQYRKIPRDVRHFLYFYYTGSRSQLRLQQLVVHTGNHDSAPAVTFKNLLQSSNTPMVLIAAGFDHLGLSVPAGETPLAYGLRLYNGATPISEERWFTVDNKNHRWNRIFHYNSSLGGFDCMYFTGAAALEPQIDMDTAERPINLTLQNQSGLWSYQSQEGTITAFNASENLKRKIRTGYKTREEVELLRDFWLAPFRFETYGEKYLPVIPEGKSIKLLDETDSTWSYEFVMRQAYNNTSHNLPFL